MNKNGYQTTVPATYTGVVFLLSWTYLMFYASTAGIEAAAPVSLMGSAYTVSATCLAVTLLVLSFSPIDRAKLLTSTAMKMCVGIFIFIVERNSFVGAFLVPLAVLVAVCVPFLSLRGIAPLVQFISIGELGIEVLIFVVAVGFAQFFSIDSLKTFALGRTVYALFNAIGWYLADAAANMYGSFVHSQVSIVVIFIGVEVLAVCLIVAIVKARKNLPAEPSDELSLQEAPADDTQDRAEATTAGIDEKRKGSDFHEKQGVEAAAEASSVPPQGMISASPEQVSEKATRTICERCGLSERERDVFTLLARGYTSPRIQKELYIAAGTVNYHARNIYAKLGVHSKQELIALFEQEKLLG